MRQIILDTETTGLDPQSGHRIVEIGALEIVNYVPTEKVFHAYINPERDMPVEAYNVHGLSEDFLRDKPLFNEIVTNFLDFIETAPLVIHNAPFDMKFLNAELNLLDLEPLPFERAIDTLVIARKKFPGSPNSLDALCRRFEIDTASRHKHGALIDAELLAKVYLELVGGRQPGLGLKVETQDALGAGTPPASAPTPSLTARPATPEERDAHDRFLKSKLGEEALWFQLARDRSGKMSD